MVVVVVIAVVIVVIPIAFRTPAMSVFVPPSTTGVPATLPRFAQFVTPAFRLPAPPAMALNCFVELVVRARNPALAVVVIGAQAGHSSEHEKAQRCCRKCGLPEEQIVPLVLHRCRVLLDRCQFLER